MLKCINNAKFLQCFYRHFTVLCIVMCISAFLLLFTSTAKAEYAYSLNGLASNSTLHTDQNGVYVTSFSGSNLEINYITATKTEKRTLKISGDIKSVTTHNGIIYAISQNGGTVYLNKYIYSQDTLNSFTINCTSINSSYKFAVSNDRIYFAENNNYNNISCYSTYGEKLYSFYIESVIDYRTYNNNLYVFTDNQIYTVNTTDNYQPQALLNIIPIRANTFICGNAVFDYSGYIINLQNGKVISTQIESNVINCGFINGYYCKYTSGKVYGYNENGDKHTLYSITAGNNVQMCSFDNKLYLLSEKRELFVINQNELSFPQINNDTPNNSTNNTNNSNQDSNTQNNTNIKPPANKNENKFSINSYYVDQNKNIIWNIPDNTTISAFKSNLTYNGYQLEFYNKDNVKTTSGNIGTGFTMVVKYNDTEHSRYSISVKGDLSGDGKINRSDVKLLSSYLMNTLTLTNEQYTASDCNDDNIINGVDILKIARNNL